MHVFPKTSFSRSSRNLSLQPQRPLLDEMPGNSTHPNPGSEREDNQERNAHLARPEENHCLLNRVREDKHPVAEIAILPEVVEPGRISLCHKEHQIGNHQKRDREDHRVCGKEQIGCTGLLIMNCHLLRHWRSMWAAKSIQPVIRTENHIIHWLFPDQCFWITFTNGFPVRLS